MWSALDSYVRKHHIIKEGDRLVLGLSGGADSICLARYLLYLRDQAGVDFEAVHVNHMLRGEESEGDAGFVVDFCNHFRIPLSLVDVDVASEAGRMHCSVEEAGRLIRYRSFRRVAREKGGAKIAVAHHRKDQVETILLHQVRGTGFRGLAGMRPVRGDIVRPLLSTGRDQILSILEELGQDYREDSSNRSLDYQRNCIRHRVLPALEDLNPRVEDHFFRLADRMADLEEYLTPRMDALYGEMTVEFSGEDGNRDDLGESSQEGPVAGPLRAVLIRGEITEKSRFEIMEVIRRAISALRGSGKDLGAVHYEMVEGLLYNKAGKRNALPDGIEAVRTGEGLVLHRAGQEEFSAGLSPENWYDHKAVVNQTAMDQTLPDQTMAGKAPLEESIPTLPDAGRPFVHWKGEMLEADLYYVPGNQKAMIKTDCEICIDYDKIKDKLTFRYRNPGDYFICDSLGHRKLLKRYFIDRKIPASERGRCLLLAEGSHVLWMQTGRVSEACRVGETTRTMLAVSWRPVKEEPAVQP